MTFYIRTLQYGLTVLSIHGMLKFHCKGTAGKNYTFNRLTVTVKFKYWTGKIIVVYLEHHDWSGAEIGFPLRSGHEKKKLGHNKFYLAIQLDLDDYLEDGFVIPQIIVTNKPEIIKCFNNIPVVAFEDCGINNILSSIIGIEHFRVHLSEPPENNQDGFPRELILELR